MRLARAHLGTRSSSLVPLCSHTVFSTEYIKKSVSSISFSLYQPISSYPSPFSCSCLCKSRMPRKLVLSAHSPPPLPQPPPPHFLPTRACVRACVIKTKKKRERKRKQSAVTARLMCEMWFPSLASAWVLSPKMVYRKKRAETLPRVLEIGVSIGFLGIDRLLITASKRFLSNQFKVIAAEIEQLRAEVPVKVIYDSNCCYATNRAGGRSLAW